MPLASQKRVGGGLPIASISVAFDVLTDADCVAKTQLPLADTLADTLAEASGDTLAEASGVAIGRNRSGRLVAIRSQSAAIGRAEGKAQDTKKARFLEGIGLRVSLFVG